MTKISDATIWGLMPIFLDSQGLGVAKIGIVAAVFIQVWGVTQFGTGFLSDHVGRKLLISIGMTVQALGISLLALGDNFPFWIGGAAVMGIGTAAVYPTLIAAVGDHAHPLRRASSIGLYRWYRDGGFVVGALIAGLLADALGFRLAFLLIGVISLFSAFLVQVLMVEPSRKIDAVRGFHGSL